MEERRKEERSKREKTCVVVKSKKKKGEESTESFFKGKFKIYLVQVNDHNIVIEEEKGKRQTLRSA
ncbi:hypothetical protein DEO72_LG2g4695 [Vigna unguiculata]|uniref:Uncharacterized protein n=1 Tax=Vigna unguiculata TaxID=3917 RepID=A0A4D6L756_VIGUN|nr:hypothetical protein DEO72_LG2g4695 [Vigna unguiculata]